MLQRTLLFLSLFTCNSIVCAVSKSKITTAPKPVRYQIVGTHWGRCAEKNCLLVGYHLIVQNNQGMHWALPFTASVGGCVMQPEQQLSMPINCWGKRRKLPTPGKYKEPALYNKDRSGAHLKIHTVSTAELHTGKFFFLDLKNVVPQVGISASSSVATASAYAMPLRSNVIADRSSSSSSPRSKSR